MADILVGTPVYDRAGVFLERYLESVKGQSVPCDIVLADNSRTDEFYGLLKEKGLNVIRVEHKEDKYCSVLLSRQAIVKEFLKGKYTHLFWVDADIILSPDALAQLVKEDKDIVSGVYVSPFKYQGIEITHPVAYQLTHDPNLRLPLQVPEMKEHALMEMHSVGFGCCLIKRHVIEHVPLRRIEGTRSTEDILFCVDAREKGYKTFLKTSVWCRHGMVKGGKAEYAGVR